MSQKEEPLRQRKRGLRSWIAIAVLIALVPSIVISVIWAGREDRAMAISREEASRQAVLLEAVRLGSWFGQAYLYGRTLVDSLGKGEVSEHVCSRFPVPPLPFFVFLSTDKRILCGSGFSAGHFSARSGSRQEPPSGTGALDASALTLWQGGMRIRRSGGQMDILLTWPPGSIEKMIAAAPASTGVEIIDVRGRILAGWGSRLPTAQIVTRRIDGTGLLLQVGYSADVYSLRPNRWLWILVSELLAGALAVTAVSVWLIEQMVGAWITYLRRVVVLHSKGRLSVRARRLHAAPAEISELGAAVNAMAGGIAVRAQNLERAVSERDIILQELEHRVKNTFQVIGSLLSLYKKTTPADRQKAIQFIEDYVLSMAAIYRTAYTSPGSPQLPPIEVARGVVMALASNAGIDDRISMTAPDRPDVQIGRDLAIEIGIYLAYSLPPYLAGRKDPRSDINVQIGANDGSLTIELGNLEPPSEHSLPFRQRLAASYLRQLRGSLDLPEGTDGIYRLTIPLGGNSPP